jgi:MFS family permease
LLLAPVGGAIADRVNNRIALCCTQAMASLLALVLGLLVATDAIQLWMVYVLAAGLGTVNALDIPIRQTFVYAMVGPTELTNAVSINATMTSLARVVGPALGGALISTVGLAACFFYNTASFAAVMVGLVLIRSSELHPRQLASHEERGIRHGLRYVRATRELLIPLVMLALIGTLTWEFPVSLPLLAKFTFHRGAGLFSAMTALFGVGGAAGGLIVAHLNRSSRNALTFAAAGFGLVTLLATVAPSVPLVLIAMVPMGLLGFMTISLSQSIIQLTTDPTMRGRVMALFVMAVVGTSAVGGPIVGLIGDHLGARPALGIGGLAAILAALLGYTTRIRPPQSYGS